MLAFITVTHTHSIGTGCFAKCLIGAASYQHSVVFVCRTQSSEAGTITCRPATGGDTGFTELEKVGNKQVFVFIPFLIRTKPSRNHARRGAALRGPARGHSVHLSRAHVLEAACRTQDRPVDDK